MQNYLKSLLAAYLLGFSYATARPQVAGSGTTAASLPKSTGTTYTVYNASLTDTDGPTPSYQFHLVCSGAEPGAALVSCDGQWKTVDSFQANHLTCTNKNVDVAVIFVGTKTMDVHITLK